MASLIGILSLLLIVAGSHSSSDSEFVDSNSALTINDSSEIGSSEISVEVPPVAATSALKITSTNLNILSGYPSGAYSGSKLLWSYGKNLEATKKRGFPLSNPIYTQFADNNGYYWGECVSAVKALSKSNAATSGWIKGTQVTSGGISSGTAIATFSNGKYSGHAAIFKRYIYGTTGSITGIEVWDQNWYTTNGCYTCGTGIFGKHTISRSGSGVSDADNYYVVLLETTSGVITVPFTIKNGNSGAVISNALIKIKDGAGITKQVTTNSNGQGTISGVYGTWQYSVSATGYITNSGTLQIPAPPTSTSVRIYLQRLSSNSESVSPGLIWMNTTNDTETREDLIQAEPTEHLNQLETREYMSQVSEAREKAQKQKQLVDHLRLS